ncbi:MAG TPA: hypothetical protein VIG99_01805 [Myxococcaceae bacterium]
MRSLAFAAVVVVVAGCGAPEETCDAPPPQLLGAGCDFKITMAVADDGVYWVNPCDSSVRHATSPEAGVTVALRDPSLNPLELGNLLVTPTDFYVGQTLGLTRYPRAGGGGPSKVLDAHLYPTSVVLVNGEAVWLSADQISAQPVNGGPQRTLVTGLGNSAELLADPAGERVYWLDIGTNSTYRTGFASLTGGTVLGMDTKTTPQLLAVDDTFLYWSAFARLERTPKTLTAGKESLGQPWKSSIRGLTVTSDAIFVLVDAYDLQQFGFGGPPKVYPSAIHRLALDGTPQAIVACGVPDAYDGTLQEHGGNLYWLSGRGVWTAPVR